MDIAIASLLSLLGAVAGALITWMLNFASELQKAKYQREHTKFTTYHAKQVEVLSEIYKQLSQNLTAINHMVNSLPPKKDKSLISWTKYKIDTSDDLETLTQLYEHHLAYRRAHAVFLDDDLEIFLIGISQNVSKLKMVRSMNPQIFHSLKGNEEQSAYREIINSIASEINNLMPEIKVRVKQIISG